MGWKAFFRKTFEEEWENNRNWGDLAPYKVSIGDNEYYGVGYIGTISDWLLSPKIQHPQGVRTRIRIKYIFWVDANATGSATIAIIFYKNSETSRDPEGYDIHGVSNTLTAPSSTNFAQEKEFVIEYDGGNKIIISADGEKLGETTLELPLASFVVCMRTDQALDGNVGIIVYEVVAEYYDQWEDWINQIYGIMQWMIPVMFVIMLVVMVVSAFRSGKKEEEEGKVIVVPG